MLNNAEAEVESERCLYKKRVFLVQVVNRDLHYRWDNFQ